MALQSDRWGPAVAQAVKSWAAANVPQDDFISDAQLEDVWKVITAQHKTELNEHQDIVLESNDIPVLPGSFQAGGDNVTGLGLNSPVTLEQRTK